MKFKHYTRLTIILLLFCLFNTALAQQDTIINRYRQYLFRNEQSGNVDRWINSLNENHQWADINYNDTEPAKWKVSNHLSRVRALVLAWADPRSNSYHSEILWNTISPALDHWLEKRYQSSNWWHNQIGVPQIMRDILILARERMTPDQLRQSLEVLNQHQVKGTGGNLVWSADLGIHYAALTNNGELLKKYSDMLVREIKVSTDEGIQPDYSFHQHGLRLEIYQYGKALLTNSVRLAWQLRGTPWAFPEPKVDILSDFVVKGWQWMARGRNTVPGTIDRAVSREGELQGAHIRMMIPYLCELDPKNETTLKKIAGMQSGNGVLSGFRYYPYSDFATYQRKDFSFFVKTISTRTLPSESINHENLKGRLLDNGDAYLIRNGGEYYNLMPVWDWELLPGITNFEGKAKISRQTYSGSVSDNESGLTAMDYRLEDIGSHQSLSAHKIWACHDDMVVCLISDLHAENLKGDVYTAMDQSRWSGDVTVNEPGNVLKEGTHKLENVKWIHHNGIGYIPIATGEVDLSLNTLTGSWKSINASQSAATVHDKVFKPVLVHHIDKSEGRAAGYVLAGCASPQQVKKLAESPDWKILSNNGTCQAVSFNDKTLQAAFFAPGSLKVENSVLTVDMPCLIQVSGGKMYASDPNHKGGNVKIGWKGKKQSITLPENGTTGEAIPFELR
ncbi:MAG: polysaccharide lyase family 8 super-sandwich domain-containing protein [Bacteroidota bacterium]|nr:polysaccharide lyase family 8 super-sandwich domain-containing protein [Bacteroidota bacterium]